MAGELLNLTFDDWVAYIFDHPVEDTLPAWYFRDDADWWNELNHLPTVCDYLTRLFENIGPLVAPYTDTQIDQGLWFLAMNGASQHMHALYDAAIPLPDRLRCVRSFYSVFEQVYAPRCTPHLGHRLSAYPDDMNPLNSSCYMWWEDLAPFAKPEDEAQRALAEEMVTVMERTLALNSDACRESALHGLGHARRSDPARVEAIIDAFLARNPGLREELRQYALSARGGCVL